MDIVKKFSRNKAAEFLDRQGVFIVGPEPHTIPVGQDGELVLFAGPRALTRAIAYAEWRNGKPFGGLSDACVRELADEQTLEHQQR